MIRYCVKIFVSIQHYLAYLFKKLPKNFKLLIKLSIGLQALLLMMRIIFLVVFRDTQNVMNSVEILQAFWIGVRFDLRIVVLTLLPLYLLGSIRWFSPFFSHWHRYFWLCYLGALFSFISICYLVDFAHFSYLKSRLDFSATRFLNDMSISLTMLWESYPILWVGFAYIMVMTLFIYLINKQITIIGKSVTIIRSFWINSVIGVASFLLVVLFFMGRFSQYPLRWSEAVFSDQPFIEQLSYNPVHYFFDTWKNGRITCDIDKTRLYYHKVANYLGVRSVDQEKLNYTRVVDHQRPEKPINIVLVLVESLATYKTSLSGNPLNPSPKLKQLANEGYYFNNYFTPSTGTARSVWTTITSFPDVELKGTSSRNPKVVSKHSIMNDFKGYDKFYFIGGSASWGNIRGVLTKNIDELNLYEEGDYSASRNDVWGISDIDLFREAHLVFKKQKKPFIAVIQTAGNHRPYTIPDEVYGFKLIKKPSLDITKHGFNSLEEFNAYRLMDHSIGHFIDLVKKEGYDKNTIFAFYGDHGLPGNVGDHGLKVDNSSQLNIGSYRVPLVLWSPSLIPEPKVIDKVASEVDILATLAGLAGVSYRSEALGRDLFDVQYDDKRYAFVIAHRIVPMIGLIGSSYMFKMLADGSQSGLYKIDNDTPKYYSKKKDELTKEMRELTIGLYETIRYQVINSKKEVSFPKGISNAKNLSVKKDNAYNKGA